MNKRISRIFRLSATSLLVAVPALADAPQKQYVAYDETNTTIQDFYTTLTWQRTATGATDFTGATIACTTTTPAQRLPTIKELLTLVDEQPHKEYAVDHEVTLYIDQNAFGKNGNVVNTPVDAPYWTGTPADTSGTTYWTLNFATGEMAALPSDGGNAYVRCVSP